MGKRLLWGLALLLLWVVPLAAQAVESPPYLYYYSQLLGGLIIERADGSDSRHIAADIIPPAISGLLGPGWSPSGKYFAAYRVNYSDTVTTGESYIINQQGESAFNWLSMISSTLFMQWSPTGEDLLLIVSTTTRSTFFWLIDVEHGVLLADFGAVIETLGHNMSEVSWDVAHQQIVFHITPILAPPGRSYRITMRFDGTTLREPADAAEFQSMSENFVFPSNDAIHQGTATSPSGRYETKGIIPSLMTDTLTGAVITLPRHSQSTGCRGYHWNADEQYIITLAGTVVAGGGCAGGVLGITDSEGEMWREIGGCSWQPCFDWLPERVDVSAFPPGAPLPVQLDHTAIVYEEDPMYGMRREGQMRFICEEDNTANIIDLSTRKALYRLNGVPCPYRAYEMGEEMVQIVVAYDPVHDLLATYTGFREVGVTIWINRLGRYVPVLKLNTSGYLLEFTEESQFLRARNANGWKIYAMADILQAVEPSDG